MPSTLYESVKKSVIEFANLRKRNQKKEDKLIFRWKLITLGLSILFIVLVGAFSQILKAVNTLPEVSNDKSFIIPLLKGAATTPALSSVTHVNLLVKGITAGVGNYEWNRANLIYDFDSQLNTFDLTTLIQKITSLGNLVIIVSNKEASPNRFAFYARHAYSQNAGIANVQDDSDSRFSTFFNLQSNDLIKYDASNCPIYSRNNADLTLFSSFTISTTGTFTVGMATNAYLCLKQADADAAKTQLGLLTGLDLSTTSSQTIPVTNLQVYQLYLDQSL